MYRRLAEKNSASPSSAGDKVRALKVPRASRSVVTTRPPTAALNKASAGSLQIVIPAQKARSHDHEYAASSQTSTLGEAPASASTAGPAPQHRQPRSAEQPHAKNKMDGMKTPAAGLNVDPRTVSAEGHHVAGARQLPLCSHSGSDPPPPTSAPRPILRATPAGTRPAATAWAAARGEWVTGSPRSGSTTEPAT